MCQFLIGKIIAVDEALIEKLVLCQFLIGKIMDSLISIPSESVVSIPHRKDNSTTFVGCGKTQQVSIPHRKDNSGTTCPSNIILYHI